jgi:hypothetical protein
MIALSMFGFLIPNGVFLYSCSAHPGFLTEALTNPVAAVFIGEAFFLMLLIVWLLGRVGVSRKHRFLFVVASLIGSLACSIPATLYLLRQRYVR